MADYDYTNVETGEDFTDDQMEDVFEEWLNDSYDDVDIAGYSFGTGRALRALDECAFREGFNNWIDSEIQDGNYREYIDSPECEDCGASLSQNDVTEALGIYDRLVCPVCAQDDTEEDADFCYECNEVTKWDDEKCTGCGRAWGYPKGEGPDDE